MSDELKHAEHADRLLDHADDMVEARDRLQASEKIWGSVAHTLKEIAERHRWPNDSQSDLVRIAAYLSAVARDPDMQKGFFAMRAFHGNFYEDEFPMSEIKKGVGVAEGLVEQLRAADEQVELGETPSNGAKTPNDHFDRENAYDRSNTATQLRRLGLPANDADQAAAILNRAKSKRARVSDVRFEIGPGRRLVKMDQNGKLFVGKPKMPRGNANAGLKKGGFKLPTIHVRHRR